MFSLGLEILVLLAALLAVFLLSFLVYVRISQHRYTEKRFNFVALWACVAITSLTLLHLFNVPPWIILLSQLDIPITPISFSEQVLACIIVLFFLHTISSWSRSWNGLRTERGHYSFEKGIPPSLILDGFSETWRIIRLRSPVPVYTARRPIERIPILPNPIDLVPFHVQALDLILGKWSEYLVPRNSWIEEASCWRGQDTSLNVPLLIVCALNEADLPYDRLRQQLEHEKIKGDCKLLVVIENPVSTHYSQSLSDTIKNRCSVQNVVTFSLEELIVTTLPLARYKHAIAQEFQVSHLPNTGFSVADVFVNTRVRNHFVPSNEGSSQSQTVIDLNDYLVSWLTDDAFQHVALLGDYGQGKSTAALELTFRILHDDKTAALYQNRIPILIRLTGLSPMTTTPEDLLAAWGTRYGLSGSSLLALHRAGRTLLIFDAFDEMANVADRADRFNHFGALWRYACQGSRILFTGRPNFFLDDEELKNALGIARSSSVGPYCTAIHIEPFSPEQISNSLRWLSTDEAETLTRVINRLPRLKEIAERPSLLFQLSQLWHHGRLNLDDTMLESATIVAKFVEYSLERQVVKQATDVSSTLYDKNFIGLRQAELAYFTTGCAMVALEDGRNNYLSEQVFRSTISKLWNAIGEGDIFELTGAETGALVMPIIERYKDQADPIEACLQAVRTHGVIEHDPSRAGVYKFSHKSFAEVLAAEIIVAGMLESDSEAHKVWRVHRPTELIEQDTVLQFCFDLIGGEYGKDAQVAEHTVFANLMGAADSLPNRLGYSFLRKLVKNNLKMAKWAGKSRARQMLFLLLGFHLLSPLDLFDSRKERMGITFRAFSFFFGVLTAIYASAFVTVLGDGTAHTANNWLGGEIQATLAFVVLAFSCGAISFVIVRYWEKQFVGKNMLGRCIMLSYLVGVGARKKNNRAATRVEEFDEAIRERLEGIST